MNCAVDILPTLNGIPYFGAATIAETELCNNKVKVKAQLMGAQRVVEARIAVQVTSPFSSGDEVLIAGSGLDELFVIGILSQRSMQQGKVQQDKTGSIQTQSGTYATINSEEKIQVYSQRQELLFEYDAVKQTAKVNVVRGNLELCAETGDIKLNAGQTVQIQGHAIDLTSKRLNAKVGYARLVFDRLETFADTLVEQAKNVYRTVAELTQLRTGRLRTLVDETYQCKANKVFMKSEDDFKIKGEKIHLG